MNFGPLFLEEYKKSQDVRDECVRRLTVLSLSLDGSSGDNRFLVSV